MKDLIEHIKSKDVELTIKKVLPIVNDYFNSDVWSAHKEEWLDKMNQKSRVIFVRELIKSIENPEENDDLNVTQENSINNDDENLSEGKTEIQILIDQEIDDLLEQRKQIDLRLLELGYKSESTGTQSKSDIVREWIKSNPGCSRSQFFTHFREVTALKIS